MAKLSLSHEDREFFCLVAIAAATNPFTKERGDMDSRIAGIPGTGLTWDEMVEAVTAKVSERLGILEKKGQADLRLYEGEDRETLGMSMLFSAYHCFRGDFDTHIPRQIAAGDTPIQVPFADLAFELLGRFGIPQQDATRFFAIFYQLRRAFYFIEGSLVGNSPCMLNLRRQLWNNIFTHNIKLYDTDMWNRMEDFSTLLLGETGTGKGAAAAAIGRSCYIPFDRNKGCFSESFTRNFISLNLSQFPETIIESELFGHRKGAFTGAMDHHEGLLSRCSPHGSIFLDEIGDISVPVQIKLLQVLQERVFSPVGSHNRLRFHGRVIAATNQPLDEMRRRGTFRNDFYYRLCSDTITVPSLRQRIDEDPRELAHLVSHVLSRLVGRTTPDLVELVLGSLRRDLPADYPWPGNVRELEQAVRRILLTSSYQGDSALFGPEMPRPDEPELDAHTLLTRHCRRLYEQHGTYEEVARRLKLDRRTVKKYLQPVLSD